MSKLSKKEIILLCAMVIVVIYGAYALFIAMPLKNMTAVKMAEAKSPLMEMTANLAREMPAASDKYIIGLAEAQWTNDPFNERGLIAAGISVKGKPTLTTAEGSRESALNYTGYLEMGGMKRAIVGGAAFAAGEKLDAKGNFLAEIHPSKIVVKNRMDQTMRLEIKLTE